MDSSQPRVQAACVTVLTAVLVALALLPQPATWLLLAFAALFAATALLCLQKTWQLAAHVSGLLTLVVGAHAALGELPSPIPDLIGFAVFALIAWRWPVWRPPLGWLQPGQPDRAGALLVLAALVGSVLGLVGFVAWTNPTGPTVDLLTEAVAAAPLWALLVGVPLFAAANAAAEEALFRGIIQEALRRTSGVNSAILIQGVAFGVGHWHGFPSGLTGVILATGYGLLLGVIRERTAGILWPWLLHLIADIVIVVLVITILA